jgi:cytochrome c556
VISRGKILGLLAGIVALACVVTGYELRVRHVAAADASHTTVIVHGDLRDVMESKVHTEYTYLSFTIWHDQPLTTEKMDAIAAASSRIENVAHGLGSYEAEYQAQGWTKEDVQFFDDKRLQLTQVAEELKKAAQKHDSSQVTSFFMHLDNTCQSCHRRFRPDLSWT